MCLKIAAAVEKAAVVEGGGGWRSQGCSGSYQDGGRTGSQSGCSWEICKGRGKKKDRRRRSQGWSGSNQDDCRKGRSQARGNKKIKEEEVL